MKPDEVATFWGQKLTAHYSDEMGNRYNVRIEGRRVPHAMGTSSIKMWDKFGRIPRTATTTLDVTFFRHYRELEQRDGAPVMQYAPLKKTIYSLGALRQALQAASRRYLEFVSALDDPSRGRRKLRRLTRTVQRKARGYRSESGSAVGGIRRAPVERARPQPALESQPGYRSNPPMR